MLVKSRTEPTELLIWKSLNSRTKLSNKDKQQYLNAEKGYEGELLFDSLVEKLELGTLQLNDLLLQFNNTVFQIDSLIITSDTIYLFEIKNYEGDYVYESDRFYKKPQTEIQNPIHQLKRSESLLRQLLQYNGFNINVVGYIIFINPEFTLYQAPLDKPFIFPSQIQRYLENLSKGTTKLTSKHHMIAHKLTSLHLDESPYKRLPVYHYDQIEKGITCMVCDSFSIEVERNACVCQKCDYKESVPNAILRSVNEFNLLFPDRKITTNSIQEWCKIIESQKRIKYTLDNHLKIHHKSRWTYYDLKDK